MINDLERHTLAAASSVSLHLDRGGDKAAASAAGKVIAAKTRPCILVDRLVWRTRALLLLGWFL